MEGTEDEVVPANSTEPPSPQGAAKALAAQPAVAEPVESESPSSSSAR